ncbi:MAG TPA: autotransporter domain-containing protein, partial [Paracoccaceae bacterium]|nr:autotransporter domain-containing protein [Paracoccaceae bacterium]
NTVSNTVAVRVNVSDFVNKVVAAILESRGHALISNQPNLRSFLASGFGSGVYASAKDAGGNFKFSTGDNARVWAFGQGQWSTYEGDDAAYYNLAFGAHLIQRENFILGALLEVDRTIATMPEGEFSGLGWLVGPYLIARAPSQPLVFSASYLYGQTENTITLEGLPSEPFKTTRQLFTAGLEGRIELSDRFTLTPSFDLSHLIDAQESYVNGQDDIVAAQTVTLTEASFGLSFKTAMTDSPTPVVFTGGIDGIYTFSDSILDTAEAMRARVEMGLEIPLSQTSKVRLGTFYDGMGQSNYEAFGVNIAVDIRF